MDLKGTRLTNTIQTVNINEINIVLGFLFCNNFIKPPNNIANKADDIAPINIREELFLSIPKRINDPKPPAPTSAARVAVPIIIIADVLTPDIIIGIAKLSLYFLSFSHFVIPNAVAASSSEGSISENPVTAP